MDNLNCPAPPMRLQWEIIRLGGGLGVGAVLGGESCSRIE